MYARFGHSHEQHVIRWCRKRVKPRLLRLVPARLMPRPAPAPILHASGASTPLESGPPSEVDLAGAMEKKEGTAHRVTYGLAAAAMLPAIWVQVPSGLAVGGSLLSGVSSADAITSGNSTTAASSTGSSSAADSAVLGVAFQVIQIAVAITVGLFISTVVVYPRGKKRGGVFTM